MPPAYLAEKDSLFSYVLSSSTGTAIAKAEYVTMSNTIWYYKEICIYKASELAFSIEIASLNGI